MGIARQTAEALLDRNNSKDLAGVLSLYAPNAEITIPPGELISRERLGEIVGAVWEAFPDWRYEVEQLVEEGRTVGSYGTEGGTSTDGNSVLVRVATFVTVNDEGLIERLVGYW